MAKTEAERYYNSTYPENQPAPSMFFAEQKKIGASKYLRRFVSVGDEILDYGCGPGGKLAELAADGYRVSGYDINLDYARHARAHGLKPYDADKRYDRIYLSHTIEHWAEPFADLQRMIGRNLKPGCTMMVEVPLIDRLLLGPRRDGLRGEIHFDHVWYFSVRSLDKLFGWLGFVRTYTDRLDLCIYRQVPDSPPREVRSTANRDATLRRAIDICSVPAVRRVVNRVNWAVRYVDVYHKLRDDHA